MLTRVMFFLTLIVLPCTSFADNKKRDIQGVALGMSPKQVMQVSERPCRFANTKRLWVSCGRGDIISVDDDTPGIMVGFTKDTTVPISTAVIFVFCSNANVDGVIKDVKTDYGVHGDFVPSTRKPNTLIYDFNDGIRIGVTTVGQCKTTITQTKYVLMIQNETVIDKENEQNQDEPATGRSTPKF